VPKNLYSVEPDFEHGEIPAVGVLLINLGTPEAPTAKALRPYLRQFLSDPRVIEISRPLWWLILNLFILTRRPKASAELYANIWTEEGSPLLLTSQRIAAAVGERLSSEYGTPVHTALGMTYGEPSIPAALAELKAEGCRRIVVFPLYSHYSSSSTGASFDAVMKELMTWRWVPELRTIHQYHDDPAYVRALAATVREHWAEHGEPEKLVTSYHGIPRRYFLNGDPYHCQCHKTTRLLAEELGLPEDRYEVTFQSLFGREVWLQPYTDVTLEAMARSGIRRVDVLCPGFSVDCLETIDEIDRENRHVFLEAGGEEFHYIPCLNDRPDHLELLADQVRRNLGGWAEPKSEWDAEKAETEAVHSRQLAEAMKACPVHADGGYGD
jgi:ferrochelatase